MLEVEVTTEEDQHYLEVGEDDENRKIKQS